MGRVFAVSDLHGMYDLWTQIKNFLEPDDTLYVLGDCADRGERGWDIIKEVYERPQTIYIKGNHEDMLVTAMHYYNKYGNKNTREYKILRNNGGESTFYNWSCENQEERQKWYERLRDLPLQLDYVNKNGHTIRLSHAGFTPGIRTTSEDLLWDRSHFTLFYDFEDIIVHGHTPVHYLAEDLNIKINEHKPEVIYYNFNHKIDIDMLSAYTGRAVLLDLDTFDEHYFDLK